MNGLARSGYRRAMEGRNASLPAALASSAVGAIAGFLWLGVFGAAVIGAVVFFVASFIVSGYSAVRSVLWGGITAGLLTMGHLVTGDLGPVLDVLGTLLFFAVVIVPGVRRLWFAAPVE